MADNIVWGIFSVMRVLSNRQTTGENNLVGMTIFTKKMFSTK